MTMAKRDVDPMVPPSGDGCVECLEDGSWWFHLRRCAACGRLAVVTAEMSGVRHISPPCPV
jgi:hypothetical protein